jgi:hypothetical protein
MNVLKVSSGYSGAKWEGAFGFLFTEHCTVHDPSQLANSYSPDASTSTRASLIIRSTREY